MITYHTPTPALCGTCGTKKNHFVWSSTSLVCLECAAPPKVDWSELSRQISDYVICDSCGHERRFFVNGICLKCTGQKAAEELIASGPWDLITD
jgi:hypothetical protein